MLASDSLGSARRSGVFYLWLIVALLSSRVLGVKYSRELERNIRTSWKEIPYEGAGMSLRERIQKTCDPLTPGARGCPNAPLNVVDGLVILIERLALRLPKPIPE